VGTWVAFELLAAARGAGLPMPRAAFLGGMAAPDIPEARRPWRRQRELSEVDFQVMLGSSCCTPVVLYLLFCAENMHINLAYLSN
jgi:surfactin synthase thioesterase subunit